MKDNTHKYGCGKLARDLSFSPMRRMKMQGFYACIYCNYYTYHVEGFKARSKYGSQWDSKKMSIKSKGYTCRDVVSLLDRGPGVRR